MKTIVTETTPLNAHGVDTVSQKIRESLTAYPFLKRRDILRIQFSAEEFMLHWMAEVKDAEIQLSIEQKGRWLNISPVLIGPGYRCDPLSGESALGGGLAAVTASQFVLVVLRLKIPVAKLWTILKPSFMVQLASASSSVAFAESYEACERGFGIDRKLVRFALPIGTVMHKPLIAAEFIFIIAAARGADGVGLNTGSLLILMLMAFLLSVAYPPVSGGEITCYTMLLLKMGMDAGLLAVACTLSSVFDTLEAPGNTICTELQLLLTAHKHGMAEKMTDAA